MKKMIRTTFTATALCFTVLFANAQFGQQGQKLIGASIGFNHSTNEDVNLNTETKSTGYGVTLRGGKFVKKNILSSLLLSYSGFEGKNISVLSTAKQTSNRFGIGYARTYYKELGKKFYFGLQAAVSADYTTLKQTQTNTLAKSKSENYGVNLGLSPVLSYQLTDRFVLNLAPSTDFLSVGYSYQKTTNTAANQTATSAKSQTFDFNAGFFNSPLNNLSIGFSYLLKH